ncbi:hypothetical protein SPI_02152 [Niveomyces insectorum RCEF 264]|uniref:DUF1479 domain protein n=1 Tax=Niveomyces insectorum RCEF 264 TaxID=1081102 RepID=A0A167XT82_9HYPO|nr:hypothetical protein SPI_02152 [Niveomyces insectorum RCEF 264]
MAATTGASEPQHPSKKEGDISDSFASMSGLDSPPLPDRFRDLKLSLAAGHEKELTDSWNRLLDRLSVENEILVRQKSISIPEIRFDHLDDDIASAYAEVKKRGVAVIRGVIPQQEARSYKNTIETYVQKNPSTRGFPPENPQVFELYWSAPQLRARSHPNLLRVQRALMQRLWHAPDPASRVDLSQPLTYADRLRIRQPGDVQFALGPHQDGGSVERWERNGYGTGGVYDAVFAGAWEDYDAWDAGKRSTAVCDLYGGLGACSVFRTFQGWLSMSHVGPGQGTLLVYPLAQMATAYTLLRPFFRPVQPMPSTGVHGFRQWLSPANWVFTAGSDMTSDLQGATPGHGQEFPTGVVPLHPHLELERTMVHVPEVAPGDFVVWHCDIIHAVDKTHAGRHDSSVLYIPVCPVTEVNARYLVRQRTAFLQGTPGPDFPGGKGESEHVDRPTAAAIATDDGLRAMGLSKLSTEGLQNGARSVTERANAILGF